MLRATQTKDKAISCYGTFGLTALIPYTVSMAKMTNHDQLFKELLTTFFVEFLELFFPSVLEYLNTDSIQFVDAENSFQTLVWDE